MKNHLVGLICLALFLSSEVEAKSDLVLLELAWPSDSPGYLNFTGQVENKGNQPYFKPRIDLVFKKETKIVFIANLYLNGSSPDKLSPSEISSFNIQSALRAEDFDEVIHHFRGTTQQVKPEFIEPDSIQGTLKFVEESFNIKRSWNGSEALGEAINHTNVALAYIKIQIQFLGLGGEFLGKEECLEFFHPEGLLLPGESFAFWTPSSINPDYIEQWRLSANFRGVKGQYAGIAALASNAGASSSFIPAVAVSAAEISTEPSGAGPKRIELPAETAAKSTIETYCSKKWLHDDKKQQDCLEKANAAYQALLTTPITNQAALEIRSRCAEKWAGNYITWSICEKKQHQSLNALRKRHMEGDDLAKIRADCAAEWPDNYILRDHCERQKLPILTP